MPPMATKTIGDLVNGEIERTLEISHQSIINAAVNMSTSSSIATQQEEAAVAAFAMQQRMEGRPNTAQRLSDEMRYSNYSPRTTATRSPINLQGNSPSGGYGTKTQYPGQMAHHHLIQQQQHHQQHQAKVSSGSKASNQNLFLSTYATNSLNTFVYHNSGPNSGRVGDQSVLPRAEIKPYLESYFTDENFGKSCPKKTKLKEDENNQRMALHPPLEGLAASLQAHVRASMKIKEETERQMEHEITGPGGAPMMIHPPIKQEGEKSGVFNEVMGSEIKLKIIRSF